MASESSSTTRLGPEKSLPYPDIYPSSEDYVEKLLHFVGSNALLQTLCGGVHVLDFFTSTPDLYSQVLAPEWRHFFREHEIMDILDLLMREDLGTIPSGESESDGWREGPCPPPSLRDYIQSIRDHSLVREPSTSQCHRNRAMKPTQKLARHVAVGMNVKKVHEVGLFTSYVSNLTQSISSFSSSGHEISHLVDFGSGQNYLGRALASKPYDMNIVAIESKGHNQDRALQLDVRAKLRAKDVIYRNKKLYRAGLGGGEHEAKVESTDKTTAKQNDHRQNGLPTPPSENEVAQEACEDDACKPPSNTEDLADSISKEPRANIQLSAEGDGTIQYIEEWVENGDLTNVINRIVDPSVAKQQSAADNTPEPSAGFKQVDVPVPHNTPTTLPDKNLMVISLHSCGNLLHHALRSLTANPQVRAVCLVGCCYNLLTERLAPATYKHPALRPAATPRLERESTRGDPNGFPMSDRLCRLAREEDREDNEGQGSGVRLNITARMMAVQAPQNWNSKDSDGFFSRHFYRALLQRIFLDKGIVSPPSPSHANVSPLGHTSGTPIIIGSLRKACYASFPAYVRGALEKLYRCEFRGEMFRERMGPEVLSDEELRDYEKRYWHRKKELSVVWSLMAFSAGVVESLILVDRWLWLREQEEVKEAWVEPVFDYHMSPRNLVIVGIKR